MNELAQQVVQAYNEKDLKKCKTSLLFFALECNSNINQNGCYKQNVKEAIDQLHRRAESLLYDWDTIRASYPFVAHTNSHGGVSPVLGSANGYKARKEWRFRSPNEKMRLPS